MSYELLMQEAQGLSEDELMEVVRFMKFIKTESLIEFPQKQPLIQNSGKSQWVRTPGGLSGRIVMSEDFDDPIPGFEEYM